MGDPVRTLEPTDEGFVLNGPIAPPIPELGAPEALSRSATFVLLPNVIGGGGGGPNLTGPGDFCPWRIGLELGTKLAALLLPPINSGSLSRKDSFINGGLCGGGSLRDGDSAEPSLWPLLVDEGKEGGCTADGVDGPAVGGILRPVLGNLCPGDLR